MMKQEVKNILCAPWRGTHRGCHAMERMLDAYLLLTRLMAVREWWYR